MLHKLSYLQIRTAKDDETKPDAAQQLFSSMLPSHVGLVKRAIFGVPKTYSFEIYLMGQTVYFYTICPHTKETLIKSLVQSAYPKSSLVATTDPLDIVLKSKLILPSEIQLTRPYYLPIRTFKELGDIDSLTSLLGFLSKQGPEVRIAIQILVSQTHFNWQKAGLSGGKQKTYDAEKGTYVEKQVESQSLIASKAALPGGKVVFRLIAGTDNTELGLESLESVISGIAGTYGSLGIGEGNESAFLPQRLDDAPLLGTRVLKLVEDDDRIHCGEKSTNAIAPVKDVANKWGKEVETDASVSAGKS